MHAAKGAMDRAGVDKEQIDSVVMGNIIQSIKVAIYLGRDFGLCNGLKERTSGLILNLLCGSGVQAVATHGADKPLPAISKTRTFVR